MGDSTHHQLQSITFVNLRITNTIVSMLSRLNAVFVLFAITNQSLLSFYLGNIVTF